MLTKIAHTQDYLRDIPRFGRKLAEGFWLSGARYVYVYAMADEESFNLDRTCESRFYPACTKHAVLFAEGTKSHCFGSYAPQNSYTLMLLQLFHEHEESRLPLDV